MSKANQKARMKPKFYNQIINGIGINWKNGKQINTLFGGDLLRLTIIVTPESEIKELQFITTKVIEIYL